MDRDESSASSPVVALARAAVETFIREDRVVEPGPLPEGLPARAGVFVTIRRLGELRGCVGSVEPTTESLAEEIIRSALLAATDDPRFPAVRVDELDLLTYSVSILEPPEPADLADLDPARYGVIVRSGHRRGLLLPGVEGITTAAQQVSIARRKAGLGPDAPVELFRFQTRHFDT